MRSSRIYGVSTIEIRLPIGTQPCRARAGRNVDENLVNQFDGESVGVRSKTEVLCSDGHLLCILAVVDLELFIWTVRWCGPSTVFARYMVESAIV